MNKKLQHYSILMLIIIVTVVFLLSCTTPTQDCETSAPTTETPTEETTAPPEPIIIEIYIEKELEQSNYPLHFVDVRNENLKRIMECKDRLKAAESLLASARALSYDDEHPVVLLAQQEIEKIIKDIEFYEGRWAIYAKEYPVACEVWRYLIETCGYSEPVAAGIIGNMMAECGGHTLDLQWNIYNSTGHYGLVQWSPKYHTSVMGASVPEQLNYLKETIPTVFNGWSGNLEGWNYEEFLAIEDCRMAARVFAEVYERPGKIGENRSNFAEKALEYFCSPVK